LEHALTALSLHLQYSVFTVGATLAAGCWTVRVQVAMLEDAVAEQAARTTAKAAEKLSKQAEAAVDNLTSETAANAAANKSLSNI